MSDSRAPHEARVESLAHGGDGVARAVRLPVAFVPDTAPGDLCRFVVTERRKGFVRGRLLDVLQPGPGRRAPPCPEAGACGGCDWQHLTEAAQSDAVALLLEDALRRAGAVDNRTIMDAPRSVSPALEYRQRARFHVELAGGRLGYHRRQSHEILVPRRCFVLEPELEELRLAIERALPALRSALPGHVVAQLQVDVPAPAGAVARLIVAGAGVRADLERACAVLAAIPPLRAVDAVVEGPRTGVAGAAGAAAGDLGVPYRRGTLERPAAFPARLSPGGFLQASRIGNLALTTAVQDACARLGGAGRAVLELYSGNGNFTLPIAALGAHVTSVESDARAVENARRAAEEAGLTVDARIGDAAGAARSAAAGGEAIDVIVLDPPRTGARAAVERFGATGARAIVYVSCDAPTLARDAGLLVRGGFRLVRATPFVLFPQTAHFETVAVFER